MSWFWWAPLCIEDSLSASTAHRDTQFFGPCLSGFPDWSWCCRSESRPNHSGGGESKEEWWSRPPAEQKESYNKNTDDNNSSNSYESEEQAGAEWLEPWIIWETQKRQDRTSIEWISGRPRTPHTGCFRDQQQQLPCWEHSRHPSPSTPGNPCRSSSSRASSVLLVSLSLSLCEFFLSSSSSCFSLETLPWSINCCCCCTLGLKSLLIWLCPLSFVLLQLHQHIQYWLSIMWFELSLSSYRSMIHAAAAVTKVSLYISWL